MIPYNAITAWGVLHPWPTREQIEQDMLLSKAICDIFNNNTLADELVFRGGTALNKLVLKEPYRYSEDLDFIRTNPGGIGMIMRELTDLGIESDYQVKTKIGQFPKVYWYTKTQTGRDLKIKIEINTYERVSALPIATVKYSIRSDWYTSEADVKVIQCEEIAATKLRALYQRSKGRDLFDLWILITEVGVDSAKVLDAFSVYRPDGYTEKKAILNLEEKIHNNGFRSDIDNLISKKITNYYPEIAAKMVINEYLLQT